ncbi:hypothetical protein [Bordetella petrii]|uniref:Uncharacterized protein n=1 Tax=Bordetella petrii (strain ATCC BAA-461 / DSM 12804 / CCUG 43448 / CIP 107267 / Se-1111R) TaxID=340100 RepID=A9I915_BORPD|nr:hypothetical protein [Bordetella petrii]CAP41316.1 hypothetical protein predicted by Glimmer/Critica [Bordetella petrii]
MAAVKTIDRGLNRLMVQAQALDGAGVKFGIQADAGADPASGVDLLDIAIYNHYGTEHIPARPFIGDFAEKNGRVLGQAMDRVAMAVQDGRLSADAGLDQLGTFAERHQKAHVQQSRGWAVPNAPSTVAKKGSDVPLIDQGVLVNAIRYEKVR